MFKEVMEETSPITIAEAEFASDCQLDVIYNPKIGIEFCTISICRPGLLLTGYDNHFSEKRVQLLGLAEVEYLNSLEIDARRNSIKRLLSKKVPCIILTRGQSVDKELLSLATENRTPIFVSNDITSVAITRIQEYLNFTLANSTSEHGVLLDVFGVGVLLQGRSSIGKSETALELIHRGHRLVADDVVELKNIASEIIGEAPLIIQNLMEIRGVGIIDVRAIYGVGSVLAKKKVELIIELENWDDDKAYERLGLKQATKNILGMNIPYLLIPVMPGRNLAIVIEVATRDLRLKNLGYNSAVELCKKMED